jgi:translation initiation factor 1
MRTTSSPVTVTLDRRRYGKAVTIVSAPDLPEDVVTKLTTHLKKSLATGGTHRDGGLIELQGDHRKKALAELTKLGYAAT